MLAPVAAAHSVLLSIDPADGATVESSPENVVLTFNEEINQSFATVAVTTADDRTNLATGEPVVEGDVVTVDVDELDAGNYTVGYRVTSADGHVVSGSSAFTVEGAAGGDSSASANSDASANSQADAGGDQADAADTADDSSSTGFGTALWVVGGLGVVLIGGGFLLLRRGK